MLTVGKKIFDRNHAVTGEIHPVLSKAYHVGFTAMLAWICSYWLTQRLAECICIRSRIRRVDIFSDKKHL